MRQLKLMTLIGLMASMGCGDSKTQIPTKQQEMPKVTPATGGGTDSGASTTKSS